MSGTVGIVANDTGRYTLFSVALSMLHLPVNTVVDWAVGSDISRNRNTLVERSLERGSEWMWFMDDDMVFPPNALTRLLEHEKDMVCSLALQRMMPFNCLAYTGRNDNGMYEPLVLKDHPAEGLIPIWASGASGMLIRSEVFRAIESPWFEHGRVNGVWNASEDLVWCEKVHAAGFDIWIDLGARIGHMTPSAVWPSHDGNSWVVGVSVSDNCRVNLPIED